MASEVVRNPLQQEDVANLFSDELQTLSVSEFYILFYPTQLEFLSSSAYAFLL